MRIQLQKSWTGVRYLMVFALIMLIVGASMVLVDGKHHHHKAKKTGSRFEDYSNSKIITANGRDSYGNAASYSTMGTQQPSTYNAFTNTRFFGPTAAQPNPPMMSSWLRSTSPGFDSRMGKRGSAPFMGTPGHDQSSSPGNYQSWTANGPSPISSSVYQSNQIAYQNPIFSGGTQSSNQLGTNGNSPFANGNLFMSSYYNSNGVPSGTINYQFSTTGYPSVQSPTYHINSGNGPLSGGRVFQSTPLNSQFGANGNSWVTSNAPIQSRPFHSQTVADGAGNSRVASNVFQTTPRSPTQSMLTNGKAPLQSSLIRSPTPNNYQSIDNGTPKMITQSAGMTSPIAMSSGGNKLKDCSTCQATNTMTLNGQTGSSKFFCLTGKYHFTCDSEGGMHFGAKGL